MRGCQPTPNSRRYGQEPDCYAFLWAPIFKFRGLNFRMQPWGQTDPSIHSTTQSQRLREVFTATTGKERQHKFRIASAPCTSAPVSIPSMRRTCSSPHTLHNPFGQHLPPMTERIHNQYTIIGIVNPRLLAATERHQTKLQHGEISPIHIHTSSSLVAAISVLQIRKTKSSTRSLKEQNHVAKDSKRSKAQGGRS